MIIPAVVRPQWQTATSRSLTSNVATWDGYCVVTAFATGILLKTGSRLRATLTPPTSGTSTIIAAAWVGMAGTAPDFDGSQVQLLFSGAAGVTLTAGGASIVSDPVNFRLTMSGTLLVAIGVTSGDLRVNSSVVANYTGYFKAADAANVGGTTKSGYTTDAGFTRCCSLLEVLN